MLAAILLGLAFNFLAEGPRCAPGVTYASDTVLKLGIALLGAGLTFTDAGALGLPALAAIFLAVAGTLICGTFAARLLRVDWPYAVLSAGAVAICGASAAMAIASVMPRTKENEKRTIIVVAGVTVLSALAMAVYPAIASVMGMSESQAGILMGASIHGIAQAIAGGYIVSDEAGAVSAIVKLVRVAFLAPVIFLISLGFRRDDIATQYNGTSLS